MRGLHVLTDTLVQDRFTHAELAAAIARGGADAVQVREKRPWTTAALVHEVAAVLAAVAGRSLVVVDDRVDVAVAAGARAVHLGRHDLDSRTARRLLGPEALIGRTANSLAEARRVAAEPIDYLGVGPVFGTSSKARPAPRLGLDQLAAIVRAVDVPVVAIGSITVERVAEVVEAGAAGIAVLGAVVLARDPVEATARLRQELDRCCARARHEEVRHA